MNIILSQRIDYESDYKDIPFHLYHFPNIYRTQIHPGDVFIYYQGDRHHPKHRYYFGCGIIGRIDPANDRKHSYAQILNGKRFEATVPIYKPGGGFYESLDYREVRTSEAPAWQRSIRRVSAEALSAVLAAGKVKSPCDENGALAIETSSSPLDVLRHLNDRYRAYAPESRDAEVERIIDRGAGVVNALKRVLGGNCQICGWQGFTKRGGGSYIEAHHLSELAARNPASLCSDNVILVCPNCHRELHHGDSVQVAEEGNYTVVTLPTRQARIPKNSLAYLGHVVGPSA